MIAACAEAHAKSRTSPDTEDRGDAEEEDRAHGFRAIPAEEARARDRRACPAHAEDERERLHEADHEPHEGPRGRGIPRTDGTGGKLEEATRAPRFPARASVRLGRAQPNSRSGANWWADELIVRNSVTPCFGFPLLLEFWLRLGQSATTWLASSISTMTGWSLILRT